MNSAKCFFRVQWTWPEVVTLAALLPILGMLLLAATSSCSCESGQITKSIANCRQIIIAIRIYAEDHDGAYPDAIVPFATDSNTVFRQLIIEGALEEEKIFGAGASRYTPDGDIGSAPDYARALQPGENHWAMTKGLSDGAPGGIPLVYENPVQATWPPTWNASMAGRSVKGRSLSGGKVIIGTNDTSVELMRLTSSKGTSVPLKPSKPGGLNLFEQYSQTPDDTLREVLDVAVDPISPQ